MQRLTSALVAGLCLCGSATAQTGNLPPVGGGQFNGGARAGAAGGIGRPDFRTDAAARASIGLPSSGGSRNPTRVGPQFGAGGDVRTSVGGGWEDRLDGRLSTGGRISAEARRGGDDGWRADERAAAPAGGQFAGDAAFDPATGGLTVQGQAELMLRNRLAAIDRLRDAALEHNDAELLEEADRLEQQARLRFQSRGRIAGPSRSPVQSADYEFSQSTSSHVTPASGHPIREFATDVSGDAHTEGRDFGLRTSSNAELGGREFGASTAARAQFQGEASSRPGVSAAGELNAGDWYNARPPSLAGSREIRAEAATPRAGLETRAAYGRRAGWPGIEAGAETTPPSWSRAPEPIDRPLPARDLRSGFDPQARAATNPDLSGGAFDSRLAAEADLRDQEFGQEAAAEPQPQGRAFGQETDASAAFRGHPLVQEPENDDTIFYGRTSSPSARAEFGQAAAAEARTAGHDFGQMTSGDARTARHDFGQATAADARTDGRDFGQATAADARADGWEFGQSTAAEVRADGRNFGQRTSADARTGTHANGRAAWTDELGVTSGVSSAAGLSSESDARRDRRSESSSVRPSAPRQSEPAPKKRGLFSWFRGRGEARNRTTTPADEE